MKAIIVGAGVGGLATRLALRGAGIDAVVLEQAPSLAFVGAGLQLSPNATRVLDRLGVLHHLEPHLVRPGQHRFVDWRSAQPLLTTPLGDTVAHAFGAPYAHAHRADLLAALIQAWGDDSEVHLGAHVARVGTTANSAWAELDDGSRYEADVLIAADGVRSAIRESVFNPGEPQHSGCMAWRGLTPAEAVADLGFERNSYIWLGPHRSVVVYYVAGGRLINWIGIGPSDGDTRESWTTEGSVADALTEFEGWHPMVRGLIERSAPPFKWALFDREPLDHWVNGRIALTGDAAHAMLPYHAQGAGQSIEDAWVLARALALSPKDIDAALAHYAALRQPRTAQVQAASRAAEKLFHLADEGAVRRRNARFATAQARMGEGFPPGQEWLFAYDAEQAVAGTDDAWQALGWRG